MESICLQLFHNMFEFQNRIYISIGWILQREILCVQIQHPSATFLIWCAPASPCLTLYYEDLAGLPVGRDSASIFSIFTSSILTYFFGLAGADLWKQVGCVTLSDSSYILHLYAPTWHSNMPFPPSKKRLIVWAGTFRRWKVTPGGKKCAFHSDTIKSGCRQYSVRVQWLTA